MKTRAESTWLILFLLCVIGVASSVRADTENAEESEDPWASPVFSPVKANSGFAFHKETFIAPASWSDDYNGDETEILAQLSVKVRLFKTRLFAAYTQKSFWQAYNTADSRPFRDTNHAPELFYRMTPDNSRLVNWGFDVGAEHESNGQRIPESRSWNRIFFAPHYRWKRMVLYGQVWYRISEDECAKRAPGCDDNPDITDFLGYGKVDFYLQLSEASKPQLMHVMVGGNAATGKGRASVSYSFPGKSKDLFWYVRAYHGYGESLLDYNRSITRVGLGFSFTR